MKTHEDNPIRAVATTDGELIVLADNYGFHVIPTDKVFKALKPWHDVTTENFIHYRQGVNKHLISTKKDSFYGWQLSNLAQAFAAELWARFVDGDVSHKPGILEQL